VLEPNDRVLLNSKEIPITVSRCPETLTMLNYWSDLRGTGIAPAWHDINLLDLPPAIIPKVMVVDVNSDPLSYIYRFFGTWHVQCHNRDMTGLPVTDFEDTAFGQTLHNEYSDICRRREPVLYQLENTVNGIHYLAEMLRLPLSNSGESVDSIMVLESLIDEQT
jgi:hypothetical protein